MHPTASVKVTTGTPKIHQSSKDGRRHFCDDGGTGLFYVNAVALPGMIDSQSATDDDPNAAPARLHIQVAERIRWMERAHELPMFDRFPPQETSATGCVSSIACGIALQLKKNRIGRSGWPCRRRPRDRSAANGLTHQPRSGPAGS